MTTKLLQKQSPAPCQQPYQLASHHSASAKSLSRPKGLVKLVKIVPVVKTRVTLMRPQKMNLKLVLAIILMMSAAGVLSAAGDAEKEVMHILS